MGCEPAENCQLEKINSITKVSYPELNISSKNHRTVLQEVLRQLRELALFRLAPSAFVKFIFLDAASIASTTTSLDPPIIPYLLYPRLYTWSLAAPLVQVPLHLSRP